MKFSSIAWLSVVTLAYATPALALTITNNDPKPQKVTVTAGGKASELTIEASKNAEAECGSGCTVKIENGEQYQLKGGETVSIQDSALFIDSSPDAFVADLPNLDPDNVPDEPQEDESDGGDASPE
jgi:hypothetical protein